MTINQIENSDIFGNAYNDRELMDKIHDFIVSENPMHEKIRAYNKLGDVMGLDDRGDEEDVLDYIKDFAE